MDNPGKGEYNAGSMYEPVPVLSASQSQDFYREGSEAEARRLDLMAMVANHVSVDMLSLLARRSRTQGFIVVDVGAGDSPRLGREITERGYAYRPIDMRSDAVEAQRRAGFDAVQSIATELALPSRSADMIHSRFTWGWLSDTERTLSLAEMLRVCGDDAAIAIIDYDWTTIEGPALLHEMVNNLMTMMRQTGFEPEYGKRLHDDLSEKLNYLIEGRHEIALMRMATYDGPIEAGIAHFIAPTIDAIATQLIKIGKHDQAATLRNDLATLEAYACAHSAERVRLPEIVATGTVVKDATQRLSPAMTTYLDARDGTDRDRRSYDSFVEGVDFESALPHIPSARRVAIATSHDMVLAARRIQTTAYFKNEIIGFDAVGDNGVLVDGNDPMDLVRRSIYFVPLDEHTLWMDGVVRIITPTDEGGIWSLPTIQRLLRHSPEAMKALQKYPFMNGVDKTVEVSGLAKNMLGGTLGDVMVAMVVLAEVAVNNGYRYGVMGLQESKVDLIEHLFGKEAIHRIDGQEAVHHIDLPGVKENSLFVPLYVDGANFVEAVYNHAKQQKGRLFATLTTLAHDILVARGTL